MSKVFKESLSNKKIDKSKSPAKKEHNSEKKDMSIKKVQSKSIEEIKHSSSFNSLTKQTGEDSFEKELSAVISDLKQKKERMYSCVQLFALMQSNNMLLRCMQHNNILTLYCMTERRILCVNCIYGVTRHRTHKIIPLKDCASEVFEDNQQLKKMLDADLKNLQESIRVCQENSSVLDKELKKSISEIELDFRRQTDDLKMKFERKKEELYRAYEPLIDKSNNLEKGIQEFKFKIWETLSKIGLGKRGDPNNNDNQIIRQVFCVNISDLTKIVMKRITHREIEKIKMKIKNA